MPLSNYIEWFRGPNLNTTPFSDSENLRIFYEICNDNLLSLFERVFPDFLFILVAFWRLSSMGRTDMLLDYKE